MKIVFMGTPEFAVPCLEVCHRLGEVTLVVSQPDRPKGRGKKMAAPPVKEKADSLGIEVYQPNKIKTPEAVELLKGIQPDVIVVVAYGQLLSKEILDIPKLGCINVHASLLPKLRGASPINWSIVTGETETGVTTQYMSIGLDEGDMIDKLSLTVDSKMTAGVLHDQLMTLGAEVLELTLSDLKKGIVKREPQDGTQSNYAPILKKEMGHIDWSNTSEVISQLIRGFDPWPTAYALYNDQVMKLFAHDIVTSNVQAAPGTILEVDKNGLLVKTGNGALLIQEIQMPNGRRMKVQEYILGHAIEKQTILS